MREEKVPSWVQDAIDDAQKPEDWQRLSERYQDSLEIASTEAAEQRPRFIARKLGGVYYTPEPLVQRLVEDTIGHILASARQKVAVYQGESGQLTDVIHQVRSLRVLDPACGVGSFLVAACERLCQFYQWLNHETKGLMVDPAEAFGQVVGVEIDPVAAEICRQRIVDLGSSIGCDTVRVEIICADALRCGRLPDANIILTNPPFEVLTNFASNPKAADTAKWVRSSHQYPLSSRGQINLYRLFLERCAAHLPSGGSLGIILPLSFMGDLQSAKLRRYLLTETRLESVTMISEHSRAFSSAAQGVAVLVARKGETTKRVTVEQLASLRSDSTATQRSLLDIEVIKALSPDLWVLPHCHPGLVPTLQRMSRYPKLKDCGGSTGLAEVLVGELDQTIHRHYISDKPTEMMLVRGEHMGERYYVSLEASGKARFVDPAFLQRCASATKRAHLVNQRLIFQGIANLGLVRRLRFALCPAGVVLGNSVNYLALYGSEEEQIYYYLGLLNSQLMNWRYCITSYGNNISNYEIGQLPIITYDQAGSEAREVAMIARQLTDLARTSQFQTAAAKELDQRMDRLIYRIYDINRAEQELIESGG
ncbi:MAG: N-6 DNA methylase [Bacillota bacterium]